MGNISLEIKNKIAIVTLDNKPVNACDTEFYMEIKEVMEELDKRDDYNVVILRSGCKHFCGGGNLHEIKKINTLGGDFAYKANKAFADAMGAIINCKKPVIAAVNGKAIGAGTGIAASCDIIIAEEQAAFGALEITVGIIGNSEFLEMLIPRGLGRYYALTGKTLKATELKALGGILDAVPPEELMERALQVAEEISLMAPKAVELCKKCMRYNNNERLVEKYMHDTDLGLAFYKSDDAQEAINSILEKRKPVFIGQ